MLFGAVLSGGAEVSHRYKPLSPHWQRCLTLSTRASIPSVSLLPVAKLQIHRLTFEAECKYVASTAARLRWMSPQSLTGCAPYPPVTCYPGKYVLTHLKER